ncbi:MAG TPA: alpha/beta hydrolase [Gemmatimonadales bacterium]|nr:alpha/beta hydrolase [Gemmatimonadales bacterium]
MAEPQGTPLALTQPRHPYPGETVQVSLLLVAMALATSDSSRLDSPKALRISVAAAETLAVTISGADAGKPLVLIPGLFGSQFGFRKIVPPLNADGYRTIIIEPLGIGASSRAPRADYSLTAQADRIARVLDALHVDSALVVAHALGAAMALRLAYQRPDLVRGLVALDGDASETAVTPAFRQTLRLIPWIRLFGGMKLIRKKTRENLVASSGDTTWVTDDVVAEYTAGTARDLDGTLKAYVAMANAKERDRLAPHLAEVLCPVRLVVGGAPHAGSMGDADVTLLQRSLRALAIDSIAGAGHYLHEERPDVVVEAVARLEAAMSGQRAVLNR